MRPESECRKPEFSEGHGVTLGDGQEWTFPKPMFALLPFRKADGSIVLQRSAFGAAYNAMYDRYIDAMAGESEDELLAFITLRVVLAIELLSRNYALTDEDLQELFIMNLDSPECTTMCHAIDDVLQGKNPKKPSAVG